MFKKFLTSGWLLLVVASRRVPSVRFLICGCLIHYNGWTLHIVVSPYTRIRNFRFILWLLWRLFISRSSRVLSRKLIVRASFLHFLLIRVLSIMYSTKALFDYPSRSFHPVTFTGIFSPHDVNSFWLLESLPYFFPHSYRKYSFQILTLLGMPQHFE